MTSNDQDIQSAAQNMIKRYGDNVLQEVDLRILELQSRNQQEVLQLWLEIREKVRLLLETPTDRNEH